jgi:hypothetical protein
MGTNVRPTETIPLPKNLPNYQPHSQNEVAGVESLQRSPMQLPSHTISKGQTSGWNDKSRYDEKMQPSFRLEHSTVLLAAPIRVLVDNPASKPSTDHIANETTDVDEAVDVRCPVVRRGLQHEWIQNVDCNNPSKRDCEAEERQDDCGIDDQWQGSDE